MDVAVGSAVDPSPLPHLMELFASAWWTADRTTDDVARMLQESDILTVLTDRSIDRLVGFARVLTDYTYVALILDAHHGPEVRDMTKPRTVGSGASGVAQWV